MLIEMTDKEAADFRIFREHQSLFEQLIDSKVHLLANGNAILSFDSGGNLGRIKVEQVVYKR